MRLRWAAILVKVLLIVVLGLPVLEGSARGQDSQDREARIHQKMDRLRALVRCSAVTRALALGRQRDRTADHHDRHKRGSDEDGDSA